MPADALASFAGVGHMLDLAQIKPGETVLDLGCGSGTDAFVAAHLTGPDGQVIGLDMTDAQLAKARRLRDDAGLDHVAFFEGLIEEPPVEPESVDVVISNGVDQPRARQGRRVRARRRASCGPAAGSRSPTSSPSAS